MLLISMLGEHTLILIMYSFTEQPCLDDFLASTTDVLMRESRTEVGGVADGVLREEVFEAKSLDATGLEQLEQLEGGKLRDEIFFTYELLSSRVLEEEIKGKFDWFEKLGGEDEEMEVVDIDEEVLEVTLRVEIISL